MKRYTIIAVLFIVLILAGCHGSIRAIVVDAETGQPIQGALAVVQWTKTKSRVGFTETKLMKIMETESDKDGNVKLTGTLSPFVDPPDIVVYKEGYVAWRNDLIYPDFKHRNDFEYKNGLIIKMERWNESYSHIKYYSFLSLGIMKNGFKFAPMFENILYEAGKKRTYEMEQNKK